MINLTEKMEDSLRCLGTLMVATGETGVGVCVKGSQDDGVFLRLEVVKVKDGKVLNASL